MTTIAQYAEDTKRFEGIAQAIVSTYARERVFGDFDGYFEHHKRMPSFSLESFEFDAETSTVNISAFCWMGDSREYEKITAPADWFDNFDQSLVETAAKDLFVKRMGAIEERVKTAAKAKEAQEKRQLQDLLDKYPGAVPRF